MSPSFPRVPSATVLLIEDEDAIRESLVEVLEEAGLVVSWAPNGKVALDRLRATPLPDVIILDLMIPVMDGWEFRMQQLSDDRLRDIATLVVSATWLDEKLIREQLGDVLYFAKPFEPARLIDAINRIKASNPVRS